MIEQDKNGVWKDQRIEMKYFQDADSCDEETEEMQELKMWTEDSGGGSYVVMSTRRWAFEDMDEAIEMLKDFYNRAKGITEEKKPKTLSEQLSSGISMSGTCAGSGFSACNKCGTVHAYGTMCPNCCGDKK